MDTIKYDSGTTTVLTGVRLNYAWTTSGGAINFLDEDVRSGNARLRGTYHNPPNTTYLENEPETGGDAVFTLSGLVPVGIRSNAGSVITYY